MEVRKKVRAAQINVRVIYIEVEAKEKRAQDRVLRNTCR